MAGVGRFPLSVILATATLVVMGGAIIAPVLNLMRDGLGVDQVSVGLIITTHAIFIAIFSPIIGVLIDRIGTRTVYVFGLVIYGLGGGAGLFIDSFWLLIASRAVLGIGAAAIITSITVVILELYRNRERDKVMGWRGSAQSFGGLLWPLLGGLLGGISWQLPFGVYLLGIPLGILVLLTLPESRAQKRRGGATGSVRSAIREKPVLLLIYGLMFLMMLLLYAIVVMLPQLLGEIGVTEPVAISMFIMVMAGSGGTTALLYGRIKSILSYRAITVTALSLYTAGFMTISLLPIVPAIVVSVSLIGIGQGMMGPAIMVWVGEGVAESVRGRVVCYLGTFGFLGQFASPVLFGPVSLMWGFGSVFLAAGVACAVLAVVLLAKMKA
jgi:MFS family permease